MIIKGFLSFVKKNLKGGGSCSALIDRKFYRRYDAKHGKTPPAGAIQCGNPNPITGHWPHWLEVPRSFDEIKEYLEKTPIEGIVFWKDGEPKCKIKRSDFGLEWPIEGAFY